jgi:CRP-like cAMP-binding protein
MVANPSRVEPVNLLLAAMRPDEYARLEPDLEPVTLPRETTLHAADDEIHAVYFVSSGVASLIAIGADGTAVNTLLIGREGMVGLPVFLGTGQMPVRAAVQIEMTALRLSAQRLREELRRSESLTGLLQGYTQTVLVELAQLILCNRAHSLQERLARWLLQLEERVGSLPFDFTHEFVAEMLGTQRPSLTLALGAMRDADLIAYSRGRLEIANRDGLRAVACGCYDMIEAEQRRLFGAPRRYDMAYPPSVG